MNFNLKSYVSYRLFSLILPWIFFLILLVAIQTCQILSFRQIFTGNPGQTLMVTGALLTGALFHSAYWFIPVSIISALILIQFKNYRNNIWLGVLLGAIAVFYSINLYYGWIPAAHTKAFAGYTFFMWLGLTIKTHIYAIQRLLDDTSWAFLFVSFMLTFAIACNEGMLLTQFRSADAFASNRASNSVLSVILFLIFLKSNGLQWINWLKPQKNAYGIYLIHSLVIVQLLPFENQFVTRYLPVNTLSGLMAAEFVFFIAVLSLSIGLVYALRHSALRFLIGARA